MGMDVPIENEMADHLALCMAIQRAISLAEIRDDTLVGALLAQALDAAHCDEEAISG